MLKICQKKYNKIVHCFTCLFEISLKLKIQMLIKKMSMNLVNCFQSSKKAAFGEPFIKIWSLNDFPSLRYNKNNFIFISLNL